MTEYEIGLLVSIVLIAVFWLTGVWIQRRKREQLKKLNPQADIDHQKEEIISLIENALSDTPALRTPPYTSRKTNSQINTPFPVWVKWAMVLSFIPLIVGLIFFIIANQTGNRPNTNTPIVPTTKYTTTAAPTTPATTVLTGNSIPTTPTSSPVKTTTVPTTTTTKIFNLKFTTFLLENSQDYLIAYKPVLDEIEQNSAGRIKFTKYFSGSLVTATDQYDAIKTGIADLGSGFFSYYPNQFPLADAFSFPLSYASTNSGQDIVQAVCERMFTKETADTKALCFYQYQPNYLFSSRKQVLTLEDIKGLKSRTSGNLSAKVLQALGGVPVSIATSEIYTALQKAVIDGTISNPNMVYNWKLNEVTKFVLKAPLGNMAGLMHMNLNTWSTLPDDLKSIIQTACQKVRYNYVQLFTTNETAITGMGLTSSTLSSTEQSRWVSATKPIVDQWAAEMEAKGLSAKALVDLIRSESQIRGVSFPY